MHKSSALAFILITSFAYSGGVEVTLDTSQVPELDAWGKKAQQLMKDWHPRITNLLVTKGFKPPMKVGLKINKSDEGVGGTVGTRIGVSSSWVQKHPEDLGMVIHELTHVIQNYKGGGKGWVTEGIADYIRWAIYEGKPLEWFPVPKKPDGYKGGYRAAAGFFLWLESDQAPGIIKRLNTASRKKKLDDAIFQKATGKPVGVLWTEYIKARGK